MEEPQTPGIAITLYVVGVISLVGGVISIVAATQDNASAAQSDIIGAVGGIVGGFLFIGMGYGLKKLCQIEAHLRFRRSDDGAKALASVATLSPPLAMGLEPEFDGGAGYRCPKCHMPVALNTPKCPRCGGVFTKRCPECGRDVKVKALSCYFCGFYFFRPGALAPEPEQPSAGAMSPATSETASTPQLDEEAWRKWKDRKK
jgi:rRNA maturation protein Nop10